MRARIDARFATAEDTAQVLGAPFSRMKKLLRFPAPAAGNGARANGRAHEIETRIESTKKTRLARASVRSQAAKSEGKISRRKRKSIKKSAPGFNPAFCL